MKIDVSRLTRNNKMKVPVLCQDRVIHDLHGAKDDYWDEDCFFVKTQDGSLLTVYNDTSFIINSWADVENSFITPPEIDETEKEGVILRLRESGMLDKDEILVKSIKGMYLSSKNRVFYSNYTRPPITGIIDIFITTEYLFQESIELVFGLKDDGTIIHLSTIGYDSLGTAVLSKEICSWKNVKQVVSSLYYLAALKHDGTVVLPKTLYTSHSSKDDTGLVKDWTNIESLATYACHLIGKAKNGVYHVLSVNSSSSSVGLERFSYNEIRTINRLLDPSSERMPPQYASYDYSSLEYIEIRNDIPQFGFNCDGLIKSSLYKKGYYQFLYPIINVFFDSPCFYIVRDNGETYSQPYYDPDRLNIVPKVKYPKDIFHYSKGRGYVDLLYIVSESGDCYSESGELFRKNVLDCYKNAEYLAILYNNRELEILSTKVKKYNAGIQNSIRKVIFYNETIDCEKTDGSRLLLGKKKPTGKVLYTMEVL